MSNSRVPQPVFDYRHAVDLQLRFNDIDMFGHLNNTVYLEFLDLGKYRYFEDVLGGDFMKSDLKVVIVNINCNFYSPAFLSERLQVLTTVAHIGDKSLTLDQRIVNRDNGDVKFTAVTVMAGFDAATLSSAQIPDDVRQAFSRHEEREL